MFRRLAAAILSAVFLVSAAAAPALAYNDGYGPCQTASVYQAGHSTADRYTNTDGVQKSFGLQATVDATLAGHICTNPPIPLDNGWLMGVQIRENGAGAKGFLFLGITLCDKPAEFDVCDPSGRQQPHYFIYSTSCGSLVDTFESLGEADWAPHQYRIWLDTVNGYFHFYIDGVDQQKLYDARLNHTFGCLNPYNAGSYTNNFFVFQRWDLGDGWGDTNNYAQILNMQVRYPIGWLYTGGTDQTNCAENSRPYPGPHYNVCLYYGSHSLKAVTVY